MLTKEYYRPQPMGVNASYKVNAIHVAGFLAVTAGSITVTDADGTVLLNAMPLATGPCSLAMLTNTSMGCTVQLSGGASGTLLV